MSREKEVEELAQIIRDTFGVLTNMTVCRICASKMVKAGFYRRPSLSQEDIEEAIYQSLRGIMKSKSTGQEWNLWLHKDEVTAIAQSIFKRLETNNGQ